MCNSKANALKHQKNVVNIKDEKYFPLEFVAAKNN
jgi:hypothetical protein